MNCKGEESLPRLVIANWEYAKSESQSLEGKTFERLEKIQDLTEISFGNKGFIFLKTKFDLPELKSDSKFSIYLDLINPTDETYLNGVWIGKTGKIPQKEGEFFSAWNEIRNYQVEPSILKEKDNELLICIIDYI